MKISYDFFKRKIERKFTIGVYPEYSFIWNDKRYCIYADLDKFYIDYIIPTSDQVKEKDMLDDFYPIWKEMVKEDPYIMGESIQIGEFISFDDLYFNGIIDDNRLKDIWNDLDFITIDDDFIYYFEMCDNVFIKDKGIYGVVKKIENINEKIIFWIGSSEKNYLEEDKSEWISCRAEQLEYDERPETIKRIKESYADYLDRISH